MWMQAEILQRRKQTKTKPKLLLFKTASRFVRQLCFLLVLQSVCIPFLHSSAPARFNRGSLFSLCSQSWLWAAVCTQNMHGEKKKKNKTKLWIARVASIVCPPNRPFSSSIRIWTQNQTLWLAFNPEQYQRNGTSWQSTTIIRPSRLKCQAWKE